MSYAVATTSADVTKGMFVATILAVPVFGLGVATLLLGAAIGSGRADIMPSWWRAATLAAGSLSTVSVFSYADSGVFSPDVQQQFVAHVLVVWLFTTSVGCAIRPRHPGHDAPRSTTSDRRAAGGPETDPETRDNLAPIMNPAESLNAVGAPGPLARLESDIR